MENETGSQGQKGVGGAGVGPRLFDRAAVALASLVGTPVAGGIVLGVNAARIGQKAGVAIAVAMGLVLTYSLLGLVPYVSRWVTPWVLLPVGAVVMAWVAGMLQGEVLAAHRKAGGKRGGMLGALGIGMATAAVLGGVLWVARPYMARGTKGVPLAKVVVTENQSVNYAPPVSEEEARRVGSALEAVGYFEKSGTPKEVVMVADGEGRRIIVFRIDPAHADDPQVLKSYALVAQQFIRSGVGVPFMIRLAGPDWKTLKEIKVDVKPATRPAGTQPSGG